MCRWLAAPWLAALWLTASWLGVGLWAMAAHAKQPAPELTSQQRSGTAPEPILAPQLSPALGQAPVEGVLNLVILPDGTGLPDGSGSVRAGEALYAQHCLACHGRNGRGGINDALAGGKRGVAPHTIGSYWPYATTVFDFIRRAMPYTAPGTLSADEVYALTAYLLHLNGLVDATAEMDAERLSGIRMPARASFVSALEARARTVEQ